MFILTSEERVKVESGEKTTTLRPIKESGKGYYREGGIYWLCEGRDFVNGKFTRCLVLRRSFINIEDMEDGDFLSVGYPNKASYMEQKYNKTNKSLDRVKYDFITLPDLLNFIESLEITPKNFLEVLEYINKSGDLMEGVNKELIFEGCSVEDLEEAFITVEANIRGFL